MTKAYRRAALVALGFLTLALVLPAWYYYDALWPPQRSFAELTDLLAPHIELLLPEGEGPFPTAVILHGCGGLQLADQQRARQALQRGYAVILVDSHTPRQISVKRNCAGRVLQGRERAADVIAGVAFARRQTQVDADRLFLVGYSHGAWSALEALHYDERLPLGLLDSPGQHLQGVIGIVGWYPYCGFGTEFRKGWDKDIPVLMLLAAADEIVSATQCKKLALAMTDAGLNASAQLYQGVSHGFDIKLPWVRQFDEQIAQRALRKQFDFMNALSQGETPSP